MKKSLSMGPISRDSTNAQNIWKNIVVLNMIQYNIMSLASTSYIMGYNISLALVTVCIGGHIRITFEHCAILKKGLERVWNSVFMGGGN